MPTFAYLRAMKTIQLFLFSGWRLLAVRLLQISPPFRHHFVRSDSCVYTFFPPLNLASFLTDLNLLLWFLCPIELPPDQKNTCKHLKIAFPPPTHKRAHTETHTSTHALTKLVAHHRPKSSAFNRRSDKLGFLWSYLTEKKDRNFVGKFFARRVFWHLNEIIGLSRNCCCPPAVVLLLGLPDRIHSHTFVC